MRFLRKLQEKVKAQGGANQPTNQPIKSSDGLATFPWRKAERSEAGC